MNEQPHRTGTTSPIDGTGQGTSAPNPAVQGDAQGLDVAEVEKLRAQFGYNELEETKRNPLLQLLTYFWGPIPWMIEAAAVLSAVVQHWADFGVISVLLVTNAVVGFWEEHQAGNAIAALSKKLAVRARVLRGGAWTILAARELVPGDRIRLRLGDIVPADARMLDGQEPVQVDQSALTGESLPVERASGQDVYSGSIVKRGEADALVTRIGQHTYFGRTAGLVNQTQKRSHFQEAVLRIGRFLILLAVGLVALIVITALARGDSMATTLQFALVLTVAGIPVAMPTVLSVTMAVGSKFLARRGAVVSRLSAVEELAGMDLLCSDKTGTLTRNELTVGEPLPVGAASKQEILQAAGWASRADDQDAIDTAVLAAAGQAQLQSSQGRVVHFVPFDPVNKRTEATVQVGDGRPFDVAKGAAQSILALAKATQAESKQVLDAVEGFAKRGFRALAVARSEADGRWRVLGVLPLFDPPRQDSAETLRQAARMGIAVKMVTGDQQAIAREIAGELGMGSNILRAESLPRSGEVANRAQQQAIEKADGFSEVVPEHKYRIIEALQARGHITGMTGDGVNDAPALKRADTGIAVAGATDAARAAADIVLMTPGLSVIIDAVQESRRIFRRMTSYATYRIAETIRILLFMSVSILVFNFYPMTAVMVVLLALLNDGAILSIAYDRTHGSETPEAWNMREVLGIASVLGIFGVAESFLLFYAGKTWLHLDPAMLQTLIYLKLSVAGHLTIFVTRTKGPFWSSRPATSVLAAVMGTQAAATLIAVYGVFMTPIGWTLAAAVWAYALVGFVAEDGAKLLAHRVLKHLRGGGKGVSGTLLGHRNLPPTDHVPSVSAG